MRASNKGKSGGSDNRGAGLPNSTKPYLIRALYDWSIDSGLTPQVRVDAGFDEIVVPAEYVKQGQIILNIHPKSVKSLEIGNQFLTCSARFSGKPFDICVPVSAVMAIYARENGVGIVFEDHGKRPPGGKRDLGKHRSNGAESGSNSNKRTDSSPHLKLVK